MEQIWRNLALHDHMLTNESSAVNGCRQNESASQYLFGNILDCFDLQVVFDVYIFLSWILSLTEEIKNILMMDIFIRNIHIMLHDILIDGMESCGLLVDYWGVFISCLDSHSDLLYWRASVVMLNFYKSVPIKK